MINHLEKAKEPIVSFGQGCEGEPLLEADLIAESVKEVRSRVKRGTININTNGSFPKRIEALSRSGVDSFRISLNSPEERFYNIYFKPKNYKFLDVVKSIRIAKQYGKFVALNLFIFPGFSDSRQQIDKLLIFLRKNDIDMIQWRNLNIDPGYYIRKISDSSLKPTGVLTLLEAVKREFPRIKTGYFNLAKESF
jgi:MoaA/NifB/PqqE/SkfB family radical SAM enzyme